MWTLPRALRGGHVPPAAQHKFLKHGETLLRSLLFCSSAVISVSVFSVWPREAGGLDTRAHGTVMDVFPQGLVKGPLLSPLCR